MADVRLKPQKTINNILKGLQGVKMSTRTQAQGIGSRAESRLTAHRNEGESSISITYGVVDSFVNLEDPDNAMAIEFGHFHNYSGEYVQGLYILTGAAGLV